MSNIMKFLIASLVLFTTFGASATCYRTSQLPPGSPPAVLTNGLWCTQGEYSNMSGNTTAQVVVPMGYPGAGGGLSKCEAIGALGGSAIGSAAANYTIQATILGGIFGGMIGNAICQDNRGQRVMIQGRNSQETLPQGERYQSGNTVTVPAKCIVGGEDFGDIPEASCLKIRKIRTVNEPAKLVFSNESTGAGICRLLSNGTARLKANPSQATAHGQVLAIGQSTNDSGNAVVIPQEGNEDCASWRRRAAQQIIWMG